jgi:hypothetical protein
MTRVAKLVILSGIIAFAFLGNADACQFDTDCALGSKCQKASGSLYGVCVGGISPGNSNDRQPVYSPTDPNKTYGDTCQFDTDCGPGSMCVKSAGIYGTCMRRKYTIDPSYRSGGFNNKKGKGNLDTLKNMLETIKQIDDIKNDRERLQIERERNRLLKEILEEEKKRSNQENKNQKTNKNDINSNEPEKNKINNKSKSTYSNSYSKSYTTQPAQPFYVFFKNGKKFICDKAWKDGSTIFLVHHNKKFAIGYDEEEIDIEKSFK